MNKVFLILFFFGLVLLLVFFGFSFFPKNCGTDFECFKLSAKTCSPAEFRVSFSENAFHSIKITGLKEGKCMAVHSYSEIPGKTAECELNQSSSSSNAIEFLENCKGDLISEFK